ncbi:MAG: hypothetical protein D6806_10040 [Deltaproteobacteria bacterium]|nr:MAG: hypothetical protein D6806_10040 [Deltaproteobacteria bacterium]
MSMLADEQQLLFPPEAMLALRLDWSMFTPSGFELLGRTSFLKGGVAFADAVTAASHEYLRQLQDPAWDPGVGQVLKERSSDVKVTGAGIDTRRWDPSTDPDVEARYDAKDPAPKRASKEALLRRLELQGGADAPLVLVAGRAGWLQGTDLLERSADRLAGTPVRFLLALDADERWQRVLNRLVEGRRDRFVLVRAGAVPPGLLLAASDCLLLPARQAGWCPWLLRGLRYGCVPVASDTGFAGENVGDYAEGEGTGFTFEPGSADSMVGALERMASLFGQRAKWLELVGNVMSLDLSWNRPARLLLKLYEQVAGLRQQ